MKGSRENNFNILRFLAALMVMAGHMAILDGTGKVSLLWGQGVQSIGVKIFFLTGGYLISKSWLSDPNPIRYCVKRIMRIFPLLIFYVLVMTYLVGPVLSIYPYKEYIANGGTEYIRNIIMYPIYNLPGVFINNPYPYAVNGSLWTLPVEMMLYILVPIVLILTNEKKRPGLKYVRIILIIGIYVARIIQMQMLPDARKVVWGTDLFQAFQLIPYYFIGMLFTFPEIQRRLNYQLALVFLLLYSCIWMSLSPSMNEAIFGLVFAYAFFSFALIENPYFGKAFRKYEFSYGIYIYGFPIQQLVISVCQKYGVSLLTIEYLGISVLLTFILALISSKLIELPCQKLTAYIIRKVKC